VLDPDGDPATPDAPHVVNNSWSFTNVGCDFEFAEDLRALRAAGILPVFAAGVRGPVSPANTPEAFAVGALAEATTPLDDSARGPSRCGDVSAIYPHVVAPGAKILTTDRFGLYAALDGTSLAAAHVSGALALLLDATPNLSPDEQADLLTGTAVDLGEPGPDNTFGYGRIDIAAALDRLQGLAPPTRAPTVGTASPPPAPAEPASPAPAELPASGAGVALIVVAILALAAFVAARRGAAKG
jgi:subtilisin family serine protease